MAEPVFLYVEDDPMSRDVMAMVMQNVLDRQITIFDSSADFRNKFLSLSPTPNIIFLDIHMEPLDGFELLQIIREEMGHEAVVIAMTASVMSDDVVHLEDAGFDGLIGKPIRNRIFPELLEKILDGEYVWYIP